MTDAGLPIGVTIRTIRGEPRWWLESAKRLDAAGYQGVWAWDHFVGQGDRTVPVTECWTILSMAAGATDRIMVGPFVINVMNRHPAVLARMASTLQVASGGRLILGMGIGGGPREHKGLGVEFPEAHGKRRRAARAQGLRDRLPRSAGARGAVGGSGRGDTGVVDRRPRDARLAV